MIHINFNSGGIGSWATRNRVEELAESTDRIIDLFTDTLIEDRDLYRFLIETTARANGIARPNALLDKCALIPDIHTDADVVQRKIILADISAEAMRTIPNLIWITEGRTPWEVFYDTRYLGNSRLAKCSHVLKQEPAERWIKQNFSPDECVLYLGIDWMEDHRRAAPTRNWAPYTVLFPMCDEPYVDKHGMLSALDSVGIARPRLYELGFAHNNCGGFCVRAGHGHFANLFEQFPEYFAYSERKEEETRAYLGKDVSMMKKERSIDRKRQSFPYTMRQLRADIAVKADIDREDIGGCGCFVNYEEDGSEAA